MSNHRRSYVALVAALRGEFGDIDSALPAMKAQLTEHRYSPSSLGVLVQAIDDAADPAYDVTHGETEGVWYAHMNGLDCGGRPCRICAPSEVTS